MRREACNVVSFKGYCSRVRLVFTGYDIDEGGFAGTVWPDDADTLTGSDFEGDRIQRDAASWIAIGQVADKD